jgi:nucleoside-triphosphatase THEP1
VAQARVARHSRRQEKFKKAITQAINFGQKVLGTIALNPHPLADEIRRHPEVEVLLVTRDNRDDVIRKVLAG